MVITPKFTVNHKLNQVGSFLYVVDILHIDSSQWAEINLNSLDPRGTREAANHLHIDERLMRGLAGKPFQGDMSPFKVDNLVE